MKNLFVFTLSLLFLSCSKNNNSKPKVYKVGYEARCLLNTVEDVSSYDMYMEFDSPSFTPIVNKWYKDQTGYFYYKIINITPVQQYSHQILISQHYDTYCQ